ncbi:hypothetical protein Esti_005244 [Eimeria stiedai]
MGDPAYAAAIGAYPPYTAYSPYAAAAGPAAAAADGQWGAWGPPATRGGPAPVDPETEPDALQSRCLFFGRLSAEVTEEVLRGLCEPFGDLRKVTTYPEKHMAFVEFFDIRHAEAAREALRATEIAGRKAEVQYSAIKRPDKDSNMGTLYIRPTNGMSASTTLNDPNSLDAYRRLFSSYGDIKKVSVNRKRDSNREPASRRVGASRTPEPFGYGPCRSSGYGLTSRGYGHAPYSAPPMMGHASSYGPYGVCPVQTAAAAPSYVSPYVYQQQQQQPAAAAYAPSWPPANPGVSGGATGASAYGAPPPPARGPVPMAVYGGAPGTGSPWRPPQ